jgi:hypothetical protein
LSFFHPFGWHRAGLNIGAPRCRRENTPAGIRAAREIGESAVQVNGDERAGGPGQNLSLLLITRTHVVADVDAYERDIELLVEEQAQWVWHLRLSSHRRRIGLERSSFCLQRNLEGLTYASPLM